MVQNDKKKKKKREGSDAVITLDRVSKSYSSGSPALDNVSLTIKKGEFVFIVGPSGAGKSTFMRMLLHETLPTSGTVIINGYNITKMKRQDIPYLRRSLGIVFQDYRLLPDKTVYENIAFAMRVIEAPRRLIQHSVNSVLDVVGLKDKYNCFPHQLSGGEQQRVAIARAIVNQPAIVIADEPTGNLDAGSAETVAKNVIKRQVRNTSRQIIMVTHDRQMADYADRIITISDGQIQ